MAPRPSRGHRRLVTLTSDVGSAYAAQMKAALLRGGVAPDRIVDLAHDLPAHGIPEAAFLLREMARAFPTSSVHLVVVDPGVGGRRAPVAVVTRPGPILVGPDNGVLAPLAEELGVRSVYRIDASRFTASRRVGTTFDGRDLFAPAAAWLASGGEASGLGARTSLTRFALPQPERSTTGAKGEVLHVDRFGNLITNVVSAWVPRRTRALRIRVGGAASRTVPWTTSYESLGRGSLGTLSSSFGLVEVAVGEGRADRRLRAGVGATIALSWRPRPTRRGENANSARPRNLG